MWMYHWDGQKLGGDRQKNNIYGRMGEQNHDVGHGGIKIV